MEHKHNPDVRSFVLRTGRQTPGQRSAFEEQWPQYGIDWPSPTLFSEWFAKNQPTYLEIGFGNGNSLFTMAKQNPDRNFIGIEVHTPGVGHLLVKLKNHPLTNLTIISHDAVEVLTAIPEAALTGLHIYFPDPWPKKKHHKRRLIQPWFIETVLPKLTNNGYIHAATDWLPYAEHIEEVLTHCPALQNCSESDYACPAYRPTTKFERRGARKGHTIRDLIFAKSATPLPPKASII